MWSGPCVNLTVYMPAEGDLSGLELSAFADMAPPMFFK